MHATKTTSSALDILLIDDDPLMKDVFASCLAEDGHRLASAASGEEGLAMVATETFDLAFLDLDLGGESGLDLIPPLREQCPWMKIVLVTGHGSIESAVEAMKRGAADYVTKPFSPLEVRVIAERHAAVLRLERRVDTLEDAARHAGPSPHLESTNPPMKKALATARKVASTEATVLLTGESGTGKGVLARAIHEWSDRSGGPFSVINCPSLTAELLRSELFGHVRGAFTGAVANNMGKISAADGGTLFLDEVGDLPASIQPQLLRFIQDREFERLGEARTRTADVRIITATNRDLETGVAEGTFREDLWYRLRVIEIEIPPLRRRREDIMPLAQMFVEFFARKYGRPVLGFTDEVNEFIRTHEWRGNTRELRNAIERAAILSDSESMGLELFEGAAGVPRTDLAGLGLDGGLVSLEDMEARYIRHVLERTDSIEMAAEVLGVAPSTLWRRRRKYAI